MVKTEKQANNKLLRDQLMMRSIKENVLLIVVVLQVEMYDLTGGCPSLGN